MKQSITNIKKASCYMMFTKKTPQTKQTKNQPKTNLTAALQNGALLLRAASCKPLVWIVAKKLF